MELSAVYVLVQLYAFFENGLYFTSVEARITIRMGTGHIFEYLVHIRHRVFGVD